MYSYIWDTLENHKKINGFTKQNHGHLIHT